MKAVFILPVTSQPRYHKRIEMLEKLGVTAKMLAFERTYYLGKPFKDGYVSLGRIEHVSYHKRFLPLLQALPVIRTALDGADVLYAFGLDMLLVGWLAGLNRSRPLRRVLEVADIRAAVLGSGLSSRALRGLERFLLSFTDVLVVTSEHYISEYYKGMLGVTGLRYHVIENKLDRSVMMPLNHASFPEPGDGVKRLGYFGLLRCKKTWAILKKIAVAGNGRIKVYIRGIPMRLDGFEREAQMVPNLSYGGPYVSPYDLPDIYGRIDMTWIGASALAGAGRANRFYEGCYFRKPMLAQQGTADGHAVEAMNLGVCLDINDADGTVDRILGIGEEELAQWWESFSRIPESVYLYTDEHQKLLDLLNQKSIL